MKKSNVKICPICFNSFISKYNTICCSKECKQKRLNILKNNWKKKNKENLMDNCKHKKTEIMYGNAFYYGCKGIGGLIICLDCHKLLNYDLDYESCTKDEIEWYEKSKWFKNK
jgi:hypothetical protein